MKKAGCLSSLVITAAMLVEGCSAPATRATLPSSRPASPSTIRVGVREGNRITIRKVPLETYVQAAILSEFAPPSGDPAVVERMFEVQAVIGRTYALAHLGRHASEGFDVCATTHCQLFEPSRLTTSRWAPQSADAVRQTTATVLWFGGAPADALYHSDCGGRTSRADDVWRGMGRPYLVSVVDDGPGGNGHAASWRFEPTDAAVIAALNKDDRTRVGSRLSGIQVLERDPSGRAEQIALHGSQERIVRGEDLRDVLGQSFGGRVGPQYVVHGRAQRRRLCLRRTWVRPRRWAVSGRSPGARFAAGAKLTAVLDVYFPGTKLVTLRAPSNH